MLPRDSRIRGKQQGTPSRLASRVDVCIYNLIYTVCIYIYMFLTCTYVYTYYIYTVDSRQTDGQIDRQTDINPQNIEQQISTKIDFLSCFGGCDRCILLAPWCMRSWWFQSMDFFGSLCDDSPVLIEPPCPTHEQIQCGLSGPTHCGWFVRTPLAGCGAHAGCTRSTPCSGVNLVG